MNRVYTRRNFKNFPSTDTPLNETNMNAIDLAVYTIDGRVIDLDTTKLNLSTAQTMVKDVSYNESNGVFTITYLNGTKLTLDTKLEKLAVNFEYDSTNEQLVITLSDGTKQYVDLKALITQYDFANSSQITFTVDNGKVTALIVEGSITEAMLQPNFLADCRAEREKAEQAASNALTHATTSANEALVSEGYAKGTQNGTPVEEGSPYYHNNAEYFKDQTSAIVSGGVTSFNGRSGEVNPQSGDYSAEMVGALPSSTTHLSGDVPITRTINGKALNVDITLSASDVGALPSSTTNLSGDVPNTRKVNNKALSADITLTASDVGALASNGNAVSATKATQDASGNVITSTYKTKAESKNVVISSAAPSDTSALWVVP